MRIPVLPFLFSLFLVLVADWLWFMMSDAWPLLCIAAGYFLYCGHREIWHNGRPLVVRRKR